MKIINYLIMAAAILSAASCGKKDETTTTTNTTNTNNTNITVPPQQTDADSIKKKLLQQIKSDTLVKQTAEDSAANKNQKADVSDKIKMFLKEQYKNEYKKLSSGDRQFLYDSFDLINDGRKEYFVMLTGGNFCGTGGCTMFILNADFSFNTKMLVVRYPLYVSIKNMTNKWRDLYIQSGKGFHKLIFGHTQYPSNPSMEPDFDIKSDDSKVEILSEKTMKKSSF